MSNRYSIPLTPNDKTGYEVENYRPTRLELFCASVMQGIVSNHASWDMKNHQIARISFQIAKEMIDKIDDEMNQG